MAVLTLAAGTATAHESPPGCSLSSLNAAAINETAVMHRNGEVIDFEPGYSNANAAACDVTGFSVSITFPKPDGTGGGRTVVAGTNLTALGGSGTLRLPAVPYTVNFNDGVYTGPVKVTISGGTFHGPGGDAPNGESSITATLAISRPKVSMTVTALPVTVPAGDPVTYTYAIKNESTSFPGDMGTVAMVDNQITDDRCGPVTYVSGDAGVSNWLDVGETWTYTCSATLGGVGQIVNHATYSGSSIRDGVPDPVTATAESSVMVSGTDLTIALTHPNNFARGSMAWSYARVRNRGDVPTSGNVSVKFTLPPGLALNDLSGDGWACSKATLTCGRTDPLAGSADYPLITLITDVSTSAPDAVTTSATVSGGGDADLTNNSATDTAAVGDQGSKGPPPGDETAPVVTGLKVTPKSFKVPTKKARISFSLSEKAAVRITVERKRKGKWRRVKGALRSNGAAGANKLRFTGRLAGKKLKPGRHRLVAVATDAAGNRSPAARKAFTIRRR